ncbi:MAG: YceI family protein [Methyloprofundus sp.]|nr:YceI family protein [Methyloprofundus sp.]
MKKILFLTLLVLSNTAFARLNFVPSTHVGEWVLNNQASKLNFITTKNASKTEVQTFKNLQGKIVGTKVSMSVDLSSVDTGIEIRDERLRKIFFNTVKFPEATVTIDLKKSDLNHIKQGDRKVLQLDAEVELQGIVQTIPVELQVIALEKNQLLVFSNQPIIVDLKNFNLLKGVNALREIAKLQSINAAVPVTFSLLFSKP